jgi:tetratricopeptide (TPR) repeat protein
VRALALVALVASAAQAAPLGAGDRAVVATSLASLAADPFAEAPFHELVRVYETGPGLATLAAEVRRQSTAQPARADLAILLGRIELRRGKRADGGRELRRALDRKTPPQVARRLAVLLDGAGDRDGAIAAFQSGLAGAPAIEARGIRLRLGALYLAAGKTAEGRAAWEEAKRSAPGDLALRRRIAEVLASRGAYRDALGELRAVEALVAKDPPAHIDVLRRESDFARRAGDSALAGQLLIDGFQVAAKERQARLEEELSRSVLAYYKHEDHAIAQRAQADPLLQALLGDALAAHNARAKASTAYHRALSARPDDRYVLRQIAAIETGEEHLRALRTLAQLDPGDVRLAGDLVAAELAAKQDAAALRTVSEIEARFPDNPDVLFGLAALLTRNQKHEAALGLYQRVAKLEPSRSEYALALADGLRAVGRPEAADAYWKLLGPSPTVDDYRRLIQILLERDEPKLIQRAYQGALDKDPSQLLVRRDYASWLERAGLPKEALPEWKKVAAQATDPFLRAQAAHATTAIENQLLLNQ